MVFDAIVIGVGSMGAATCYQLAKRGQRVLGLEQFGIVHDEGSHTGQSRIIRKAYFEHPDYVPLLESAYAGWQTLEEESGTQLYWPVGLAYFGEPGNPVLVEAQSSAQAYQLPLERKPPSYFPSFQLPTDWECWLEPEAGYLSPELAIRAFAQMAQHHGAEIRTQQRVMDLEVAGTEVVVRTEQEEFKARKLVITAGAFIKDLVNLSVPLQVTRQYLAWTETDPFGTPEAPCWVIAEPGTPGIYYGFPQTEHLPGPRGMKFGHHRPGDEWIPHLPDGIPAETKVLNGVLDRYFHRDLTIGEWATCKYTYSEDEHFILDFLPEYNQQVIVATGFSGHGFKFVPVIGEILADLVQKESTEHPAGFLGLGRFSR